MVFHWVDLTCDGLQLSMRSAAASIPLDLALSAGVRPHYTMHPRREFKRDETRSKRKQHIDRHTNGEKFHTKMTSNTYSMRAQMYV